MTRRCVTLTPLLVQAMLACPLAAAAPPSLQDYARGIQVDAASSQPLIELTLPDAVYQTVTRSDLGDVRVFNAEGRPVPHALCSTPEVTAKVVSQQALPVFVLQLPHNEVDGAHVEIQTSGGTQLNVKESNGSGAFAKRLAYIVDARSVEDPLQAIRFDWRSPDDVSEIAVRIEASIDLDRWEVVVPTSTLLRATRGAEQLERQRVELPERTYRYLRVERVDAGPALLIEDVTAERVAAGSDIEPRWFMANAAGRGEHAAFLFDAGRLAPLGYGRIHIDQQNSSARVVLESRPDQKAVWRERWRGEVYRIATDAGVRQSPPARFEASTDRHWRVWILDEPHAYETLSLELGYRPARLRFLAQGAAPFTAAFGSQRVPAARLTTCESLLADVSTQELEALIAEAQPAEPRDLGGDSALTPLPKTTPVRVVVLWSVLVLGVGLLVAMALSLLKRLNSVE